MPSFTGSRVVDGNAQPRSVNATPAARRRHQQPIHGRATPPETEAEMLARSGDARVHGRRTNSVSGAYKRRRFSAISLCRVETAGAGINHSRTNETERDVVGRLVSKLVSYAAVVVGGRLKTPSVLLARSHCSAARRRRRRRRRAPRSNHRNFVLPSGPVRSSGLVSFSLYPASANRRLYISRRRPAPTDAGHCRQQLQRR